MRTTAARLFCAAEAPRRAGRGGRGRVPAGAGPARWPADNEVASRIELREAHLEGRVAPGDRTPRHRQGLDVGERRALVEVARELLDHLATTLHAHANPPVPEVHHVAPQPELRGLSLREVSVAHTLHMSPHDDLRCTLRPGLAHGTWHG